MPPLKPTFALVHADGSVEQTTTTKAEARDVAFRWKMNQKVTLRVVELVEKPTVTAPKMLVCGVVPGGGKTAAALAKASV